MLETVSSPVRLSRCPQAQVGPGTKQSWEHNPHPIPQMHTLGTQSRFSQAPAPEATMCWTPHLPHEWVRCSLTTTLLRVQRPVSTPSSYPEPAPPGTEETPKHNKLLPRTSQDHAWRSVPSGCRSRCPLPAPHIRCVHIRCPSAYIQDRPPSQSHRAVHTVGTHLYTSRRGPLARPMPGIGTHMRAPSSPKPYMQ